MLERLLEEDQLDYLHSTVFESLKPIDRNRIIVLSVFDISISALEYSPFLGFLENNAVTNGGQDPERPGPTIPHEDRMGVAKDLELLTWISEGYEYKGIAAAHLESSGASS